MKKIFLKSLPIFFVAALCFTLTSCGGGDDDLSGSGPQTQQNGDDGQNNGGGNDPQNSQQYGTPLTLEAISNGTITFKNRAAGPVSYRIDNGNIQTIAAGTDGHIPVSAGQKVALFGDNATYNDEVNNVYSNISSTAEFYAYGNMMSLITSTGYESATVLSGDYTFRGLFENSVNLKNHPSRRLLLPATTLTKGCYSGLFFNCTGLTNAPSLPATNLTEECYFSMFSGCTSLISSPSLEAETLAKGCYFMMFNGCTNINFIICYATDTSASLCTYQWLNGVSSTGVFVMSEDMSSWTRGTSGIPSEWEVQNVYGEPTYSDINSTPLTLEAIADGTITFQNKAAGSVIYKIDGSEESQTIKTNTTKTIYVTAGQKVRFFGDNSAYYGSNIKCDADCYIYGNIMSLIYSKDYVTNTTLTKSRTFESLFSDNVNLNSHPNKPLVLPAMSLKEYCYQYMFSNCTSLTIAPELPATTMAERCYFAMFSGCKNLTSPPELPATTLAKSCYCWMFSRCTNLTSAPKLPAKNLTEMCYQYMFNECSSLTAAPTLPATTMAEDCYLAMFLGCTSLTEAPKLSSTILAKNCYSGMFDGCTSLVKAPQLPATTLAAGCYNRMFHECSSLTTASTLPATIMTKSCYKQMFSGCKSLTAAPNLPATTLAESCYEDMFNRCSALTMAPALPATTLATKCYYYMFAYCSKLQYVKCLATNKSATDCTTNWLYNVPSTGTFVKKSGVSWSSGSSGIPSGWTVKTE